MSLIPRVLCCTLLLSLAACDAPNGGRPGVGVAEGERQFAADGGPMMQRAGMDKAEAGVEEEPNVESETYEAFVSNPFRLTAAQANSTFSADVNTAAYSNLRRFIETNERLPPPDSVRIAEMINYFNYDYQRPTGNDPVAIDLEMAPCPWKPEHRLLRIAVAAMQHDPRESPPRNFVFLIDVSGSMSQPGKLDLVKRSLRMLVEGLASQDRVSIVTYAGDTSVRLNPTPGDQKDRILQVIDGLVPGGSTAGANGLQLAYDQAMLNFNENAINRVILATDGDFNVGPHTPQEMEQIITEKRKSGVYLTVLGFGMGSFNDQTLETLARHGNGHYAYIDSEAEARKVFVEQGGALVTVAKDVKLQVQFNPEQVQAYRLIGYENRLLSNEDFSDDTKDAGDMGSGHTVTALYEVVPVGVDFTPPAGNQDVSEGEGLDPNEIYRDGMLQVRMRYKHPREETSELIETPLADTDITAQPSKDFRFSAAVAAFGMILRQEPYKGNASFDSVIRMAQEAQADDPMGHKAEFVRLVALAKQIAE